MYELSAEGRGPRRPTSIRSVVAARRSRRDETRTALYHTGHALILSSAITSTFGAGYWFLAARIYTREAVGLNSAAISALMFLAGVAQLNMGSMLARFVPAAGRGAGTLIRATYVVSVAFAALLGVTFVVSVRLWLPRLDFLAGNPALAVCFVIGTMSWCVFNLQDSALAGLHHVWWVPIENGVYAATKLGLLLVLAAQLPRYGIFLSWTVALVAALVPVTLLILRRFVAGHEQEVRERDPIEMGSILRYVRGDFLGSIFWLGATMLPAILVTEVLGPAHNASFALAWVIAFSIYLVSNSMSVSLVVAEAADEGHLATRTRRVLKHTTMLVVPAVVVVLVSAPWILSIFGRDYADDGTKVLRLLALSAIPDILTAIYIGVARAQRRVIVATVVLGILFVLVTGLCIPLLQVAGVNGAGWAWLIAQTVVATAVYRFGLRPLLNVAPVPPVVAGLGR